MFKILFHSFLFFCFLFSHHEGYGDTLQKESKKQLFLTLTNLTNVDANITISEVLERKPPYRTRELMSAIIPEGESISSLMTLSEQEGPTRIIGLHSEAAPGAGSEYGQTGEWVDINCDQTPTLHYHLIETIFYQSEGPRSVFISFKKVSDN